MRLSHDLSSRLTVPKRSRVNGEVQAFFRERKRESSGKAFRQVRRKPYPVAPTSSADRVISIPLRSRLKKINAAITTATVPATIAIAMP